MSTGLIHLYQARRDGGACPIQTALLNCGLALRVHSSHHTICEALTQALLERQASLVILYGTLGSCCDLGLRLRQIDAAVYLLAVLPTVDCDTLLQAMRSGIDACWHDGAPPTLIARAVQRIALKQANMQGPATQVGQCLTPVDDPLRQVDQNLFHQRSWRLASRGWVVQAPGGETVHLTSVERAIFMALLYAAQQRLSHAELLRHIQRNAKGGNAEPTLSANDGALRSSSLGLRHHVDSGSPARRLSVLVSRLRRKFALAGLSMPIRSVRGIGYELSCAFCNLEPPQAIAASPVKPDAVDMPS